MIRHATREDLPEILAIYNEIIANSAAVWFDDPMTLEDRTEWFEARAAKNYPILVKIIENEVAGFSTFGDFRPYPGYRFTVEHTVHVRSDRRGAGVGRPLMEALFPIAHQMGKHIMIGAIDGGNEGSIRFHEKLGFRITGRMPEVGYKFGGWREMVLLQKTLDAQS